MRYKDVKVGMRVKVCGSFPSEHDGWENDWVTHMNAYIGRVFTVSSIKRAGIGFKESDFRWPWQVLELAEELPTPKLICLDKRYKTINGEDVVIYCIDAPGEYPVHGRVKKDSNPQTWTKCGKFFSDKQKSPYDLIEYPSLVDFKIDDLVMVRDAEEESWLPRHFAEISKDGNILAFSDGKTSWTTKTTFEWKLYRKPTEAELKRHDSSR